MFVILTVFVLILYIVSYNGIVTVIMARQAGVAKDGNPVKMKVVLAVPFDDWLIANIISYMAQVCNLYHT